MLYIIRHGQTAMNKRKALQGRSDLPLNEAGAGQAAEAGAWFREQGIRFDRVYSSPLVRAVRTAELVAGEGTEVLIDERLIEMEYGPYEGMALDQLTPEVIEFFKDFVNNPAPEGMEPLPAVVERLGDFLRALDMKPEENILISTHAIAMKGALEYLTPDSGGQYWSKYIGNCAVYAAGYSEETGFTVPAEVRAVSGKPGQ